MCTGLGCVAQIDTGHNCFVVAGAADVSMCAGRFVGEQDFTYNNTAKKG